LEQVDPKAFVDSPCRENIAYPSSYRRLWE
jgi:hypothetical protein